MHTPSLSLTHTRTLLIFCAAVFALVGCPQDDNSDLPAPPVQCEADSDCLSDESAKRTNACCSIPAKKTKIAPPSHGSAPTPRNVVKYVTASAKNAPTKNPVTPALFAPWGNAEKPQRPFLAGEEPIALWAKSAIAELFTASRKAPVRSPMTTQSWRANPTKSAIRSAAFAGETTAGNARPKPQKKIAVPTCSAMLQVGACNA